MFAYEREYTGKGSIFKVDNYISYVNYLREMADGDLIDFVRFFNVANCCRKTTEVWKCRTIYQVCCRIVLWIGIEELMLRDSKIRLCNSSKRNCLL